MLKFSALEISDREKIDPAMQKDGTVSSIRTFSSLYIWGEHYQTCVCVHEDIVFFKACYRDDLLIYYMPLGDNLVRAVEIIEQDAKMHGMDYEITLITEDFMARLEVAFPGKFDFVDLRAEYEYVYRSEDMIALKGKKYHGKRNFINRFKAQYNGSWEYTAVDPVKDYDEILEFVRHWCEAREDDKLDDYRYEYSAIKRALKNFDVLDMRGGIIRIDGRIVAFTLATPQNEKVIDILIEKADPEIEGAYQMINNQFAMRECEGFEYINREEDMGIDGLRQAKLSYNPAFLTAKHKAVPKK